MIELRTPEYLSPSSLAKFETDRQTFFEIYLSPIKKKKPPQQDFMAMGSAFDAFVKSAIHKAVYGEATNKGSKFDFEVIFEKQVEPHIRDAVLEQSRDIWNQYVESGAYGVLLADIVKSPYAPEMEFTVKGEVEGVPLLGKPDLRYVTETGVHVIADWKVNGSASKTGASPVQGYKVCHDYGSKTHGQSFVARRLKKDPSNKVYKDYTPIDHRGVEINQFNLEEYSPDWADQLSIYSWLLGEDIGSETFVVRMEQAACRPVKDRPLPRVKFATHMSRIGKNYQQGVLARVKSCWETIMSGHIFTEETRERSDEICEQLVEQAKIPAGLHPALACSYETTLRFK